MKLLALVKGPASIARYLATVGRRPRCRGARRVAVRRKSRVLRLKVLGEVDEGGGGRGRGADEVA